MNKYSPKIEIYPGQHFNLQPDLFKPPWYRSQRFLIFSLVFLLSATVSLIYNYSRPAIYRSSASVLTSAMTAIDSDSAVADAQHVAIQKQLLQGHDLLNKARERLKMTTDAASKLTDAEIQNLLTVVQIPDTNLVEIRAEGKDAEFLPLLVNTWTDVYQEARAEDIKNLTENTTQLIVDELNGLAEKINVKRVELEAFRKDFDIASSGREENEPLARLNGLNSALNKADEEEVKAKAALDAVKSAIDRGQAVVPRQEQGGLQALEKSLQELHGKLTEFDNKFTRDYMAKKYKYNPIPEQIKKLEAELKNKQDYGKRIVLTEAENNYAAARQTFVDIHAQLADHKKQAASFTTKFSEYVALKTDLEGLEKIHRETQERLVKIETGQKEKYPQVTVIDRAYASTTPVRPDYSRDALIALAGSLLLGLFTVWIVDYLTQKQEQPSAINLSDIHLYNPVAADLLNYQHTIAQPLEQKTGNALSSPLLRELSSHQLRQLLNTANLKGKQLIGFLLSGLTFEEATSLTAAQIDLETATLTVGGARPRTLTVSSSFKALLAQSGDRPAWDVDQSAEDLAAALLCAAVDSGLPNPTEITAAAIRHSYITYLVRQGLRLSELEQITGQLEASVISSYSSYSPPQQGRSLDEIEWLHPALVDIA